MASKSQSANEQMVQLITQQTIDLLATLKNDVSQLKSLTEENRKSCEAICEQASTEYNRLKIQYLRETLILIDKVLNTSDEKDLKEIHEAWTLQLDYVTSQCERIASPLVGMFQILSRNERTFRKKYRYYLGGTGFSILLAAGVIALLIAHCHPGCALQLAAELVLLASLGLLLLIAIGIGCITGAIKISTLWKTLQKCSDSVQLIINKNFGRLINGSGKVPSVSELTLVIKNNINTLKITEDMWHKRIVLESIQRLINQELTHLQGTT